MGGLGVVPPATQHKSRRSQNPDGTNPDGTNDEERDGGHAWRQLDDQPPRSEVVSMYSSSRSASSGRSRKMWRVLRSSGTVPVNCGE